MPFTYLSVEERFNQKWTLEPSTGCWLWTASVNKQGYGFFKLNGKMQRSHRVSWILRFGELADDICVLHKCDVTGCVNPYHLFLGSYSDNQIDAITKGRRIQPKGYGRIWASIRKTGVPLRQECPRGHQFDKKNLYINKNGHHVCRACSRMSYVKRRLETGKPVVIS